MANLQNGMCMVNKLNQDETHYFLSYDWTTISKIREPLDTDDRWRCVEAESLPHTQLSLVQSSAE